MIVIHILLLFFRIFLTHEKLVISKGERVYYYSGKGLVSEVIFFRKQTVTDIISKSGFQRS